MKKFISIILAVVVLIVSMNATAFAYTNDGGSRLAQRIQTLEERQEELERAKQEKQARQEERINRREECEAFMGSLNERRDMVFENRQANIELMIKANQLRLDLHYQLDGLGKSGVTLLNETSAQLDGYNSRVLELIGLLKETKGQIIDIRKEYRGFIGDLDHAAMESAFSEIAKIQENRHDLMTEMIGLFEEMNNLLSGLTAVDNI